MSTEIDARLRRAQEVTTNLAKVRKLITKGGNKENVIPNELYMIESILCMEVELLLKVLKVENTEYPGYKKAREDLINAR